MRRWKVLGYPISGSQRYTSIVSDPEGEFVDYKDTERLLKNIEGIALRLETHRPDDLIAMDCVKSLRAICMSADKGEENAT